MHAVSVCIDFSTMYTEFIKNKNYVHADFDIWWSIGQLLRVMQ